jgi:hypothetical protein
MFIQPFPSFNVTFEMLINPSNHNSTKAIFTVKGFTVSREQLGIICSLPYECIPPSPYKHKHAYAQMQL